MPFLEKQGNSASSASWTVWVYKGYFVNKLLLVINTVHELNNVLNNMNLDIYIHPIFKVLIKA